MRYQRYKGDDDRVVGRVESESEEGVWYVIRRGNDGVLRCECPDFQTDPRSPEEKQCKHLKYQARIKSKVKGKNTLHDEFSEIETI